MHTFTVPVEFPSKSDSSTCSYSSKSCVILSLAACYLRAGSEEGQSVEKAKTGDTMSEREGARERERPFIHSDKETSRIGVYHTFNWTSSLCLAGRWKWTTGMCQLAPRPSTSPVHSCYQPPTISISPSLHLSILLTLPLSLLFTPHRLGSASLPPSLSLSVFPHVYTWHIAFIPLPFVIHLDLLLCFPSLHLSLYISVLCPAYIPLCLLCLSIIAYERIPCILACFSGFLSVALLSLACHCRLRINLYIHT